VKGLIVGWSTTLASIIFTYSLLYAKAAAVQSIENTKVIVQTLLIIIMVGELPNLIEFVGMVLGIFGAVILVAQNK